MLWFFHFEDAIDGQIFQRLDAAAGPMDDEFVDGCGGA